ncbi:hypothetical protein EDB85DRAFT_1890890 [Lactarius pseudohatsudake]|nr:hypothetical protein EDB85DRAFT_1890890 [Lactarius pseudohatsudake]
MVLPSDGLSVSELLELCLPTPSNVFPTIEPELCFSNHPPTESVAIYLSRPVPPATFIKGLRSAARQAMLNGKLSIVDWTCKNSTSFFSFELIEFWTSLTEIIHVRQEWEVALQWLEQAARDNPLDEDVREVHLVLQGTPWKADLQLLRSRLTFREMVTFLSNNWLSSSQIDMALSSITARQRHGGQERCRYLIGTTILSELLESSPLLHNKKSPHDTSPPLDYDTHAPQHLRHAGAHLSRYHPDGEVTFIAYSHPGHWAAISITSQGTLEWADSLGRRPPSTLVAGVRKWLRYHSSSSSFSIGNNFHCSRQTDGYSCGIIALNAIKHRIFGDALWCEKNHAQLRIREFLDIMRMCHKIGKNGHVPSSLGAVGYHLGLEFEPPLLCSVDFSSPISESESPHPLPHPLPPIATLDIIDLSSDLSSEQPEFTSATSQLTIEVDELWSESPSPDLRPTDAGNGLSSLPPSPVTTAAPVKRGLHSYFPTVHIGKRSNHDQDQQTQPSPKRVRIPSCVQPTPAPSPSGSRSRKPMAARIQHPLKDPGRSLANKLALNKAVEDGTFQRDERKWAAFKSKIMAIDPQFEVDDVDPRHARKVLHVKRGNPITMAMVYDTNLYKRHTDKCKSRKSTAGMHTLDKGLKYVFCPQSGSSMSKTGVLSESTALWPCPGVSEDDEPQIETYLLRTTVPSAGGISIEAVAEQMYNTPYRNLAEDQKQAVRAGQVHTHKWSLDHQRKRVFAIGEKPCLRKVIQNPGRPQPCCACKALLGNRAFQTAINRDVPDDVNRKFTPLLYQAAEIAKICAKHSGLGKIFDKDAPHDQLLFRFARGVADGLFEDKPMFLTFTSAMVTLSERHARGHGLQGMRYPPAFDEWCHELLCISPAAYRVFRGHFGGRTERSFHQIRSKIPIFRPGITPCVYQRARRYCVDYGYPLDGPLAIGVDDTALLEAIRPFFDPTLKKWFAIGLVGDPVEIVHDDADEFRKQLECEGHAKAAKLRLWTLQIPLSHVPPLVVAVAAISSATKSSTLAQMDEELLRVLMRQEEPLHIVSLGSDGAISERKARKDLIANLIQKGEGEIYERHIKHPDGHSPPITVPLLRVFGQVLTVIQDSKHCRKTLRNNLFSGARAIVLARHVTFYQQVRDIADDTAHSPLHRRDVERLDRQDDRAAERLFSSATLAHTINHLGKTSLGLTVYLFVFGDLVDAYQSRSISHAERVIMVLRAKFFKDLWKSFLHEGGYSEQRYFISRDADNIIDTLVSGLLGLIFIHRDTLDQSYPLMPWTHGSESNEHVFGLMRSLISDFTMLDVLRMIPKLMVRLQAACRSRYQHFGETASGYSHTYFQDDDTPLHLFSQFPSDQTLDSLANVAYDEAMYLWSLLGYDPCETPMGHKSRLGNSVPVSEDVDDDSEDHDDDTDTRISERRELIDALEVSSHSLGGTRRVSRKNCKDMNEYTFAAAALNLQDFNDFDSLPESDPAIQEDLVTHVQSALQGSLSNSTTPRVQVGNQHPPILSSMPLAQSSENAITFLVEIRQRHQTKEAEKGVRRFANHDSYTMPLGRYSEPTPGAPEDPISERRLLAQKIRDIVNAVDGEEKNTGSSTGLNRQIRWTKTPGLYSPSLALSSTKNEQKSGNSANALEVAQKAANLVVKKRRTAFNGLVLSEDLSTAKVNALTMLQRGSYGIASIEDDLMICQVLTMYEKGGGKVARHACVRAHNGARY